MGIAPAWRCTALSGLLSVRPVSPGEGILNQPPGGAGTLGEEVVGGKKGKGKKKIEKKHNPEDTETVMKRTIKERRRWG